VQKTSRFLARAVLLVLIGWCLSAVAVIVWGKRDASAPADAIVVLGAAQYDGRPSPVLRSRLDHALDLWTRQMAPTVILTGGQGKGDTTSEAAVGREYLRKKGIPAKAMLMETKGRSTAESLDGVARLMDSARLDNAIMVSDPFHMLRLQILSWQHGLDVSGSPTRTSPISANRTEALTYVMSESIKVPASLLLAGWRAWTR
jgi:uncharacterized SAM-binding protein YcdF (DUF218 family)